MKRTCSHHRYGHKRYKQSEPEKFHRHLRTYIGVIGGMALANLFWGAHIHFQSVAFWWGIGLAIHYLNVFGWESLRTAERFEPTDTSHQASDEYTAEDELVELQKPRRAWREKDLV